MISIGGTIAFGKHEWRILDIKDGKALLLSDEIIEQRDYHDKKEEVTWETSETRNYLNNCFMENFDHNEKKSILPVVNANKYNPWYGSKGGNSTEDRIFLLSLDDVVRCYFGDSGRLLDNPRKNQRYWFDRKDENNTRRKATFMKSSWWWWLRTPGKNNKVSVYIHGDGNVGIQGNGISKTSFNTVHPKTQSNKGGIRPALWLTL